MSTLLAARKALAEKALSPTKILIYGDSKAGKTRMVATLAKIKAIKRIYWFDLEHGIETLLHAYNPDGSPLLTDEELDKITVFNVVDTPDLPVAGETILRAFSSKRPLNICHEHGKINCKEPQCAKTEAFTPFHLFGVGKDEAVVIDSGSQLGTSVLNISIKQNDYKHLQLYYADATSDMNNILTLIQAVNTNIVMITHSIDIENEEGKILKTVPLVLSRNYSKNVGKYFGQVAYLSIEMRKFKAGSTPTYKSTILSGSRTGAALENIVGREPTMQDLLFPESS